MPVSAADFVRHFAKYREEARNAPVFISHHGRKTHVLCEATAFENLRNSPAGASAGRDALNTAFTLADWIDEALIICDHNLVVTFANRVAGAFVEQHGFEMIGKNLLEVLPKLSGSLMEIHARRTLIGSEPSSADIPSPFSEGAWLRFQSFPLDGHLVLKFRDITQDVSRHQLADVKEAIIRSMMVHGEIGYVRLSVRGTIDRIDQPLCEMLALPEERLNGVQFADLIATSDKHRFRETLESVLRDKSSHRIELELLSNSGELLRFLVAMVSLHGAYGAEGAVCVLTRIGEAAAARQDKVA